MRKGSIRLLCAMLCIALLMLCSAVSATEEDATAEESGTWGDLTWTLDANGTLTISGKAGMYNLFDENDAWNPWKNDIKEIVIQEGVESIGINAFINCINLTKVTMPKSMIRIGSHAFAYCTKLNSARIPKGVWEIEFGAFRGCSSLSEIVIPYGVEIIEDMAFYGCRSLPEYSNLHLPDTVKNIGNDAFADTQLTSVSLLRTMTLKIGKNAFDRNVQIQFRDELEKERTSILDEIKIVDFPKPAYGFKMPVPADWSDLPLSGNGVLYLGRGNIEQTSRWSATLRSVGETECKNPDDAKEILSGIISLGDEAYDIEEKWTEADSYPVRILTYKENSRNYGNLLYARDSLILDLRLYSYDSPVTMEDMDKLTGFIGYDETQAAVMAADIEPEKVRASILDGEKVDAFTANAGGFKIPAPLEWKATALYKNGMIFAVVDSEQSSHWITRELTIGESLYSTLCKGPDEAKTILSNRQITGAGSYDIEEKWAEADGYPVRILTYKETSMDMGVLLYARNSVVLEIILFSYDYPVTMEDMDIVAGFIGYDETQALFTAADAGLTISAKDDPLTITAGKNMQFSSAFANPEKINKKNKNDDIVWSVGKADTGDEVEGVSINAKGQMKVNKSLAEPVDLQVKVMSERFGTSATYNITAMPIIRAVILEPTQLSFYAGTEDAQNVTASLDPASVPPVGLTWTATKNGIVEIAAMEDGTASIKPLAAGKTYVVVKEPGGKSVKLTVNVLVPVETVELNVKGTPKAGGKLNIGATISPRNAGNKALEWSVDVGEDIATISEKGQLKIGKEVPSGTKITVTCTALGAPTPVTGSVVVEVP